MIKRFKVEKLNGKDAWNFDFAFHSDINVFTGKNGAGKTTVLKLLWYLVSGNIERVFQELTFSSVLVEGDKFKLEIVVESTVTESNATVSWDVGDGLQKVTTPLRLAIGRETFLRVDNDIANASGSSVLFPTFRRIEGGFSLSGRARLRSRRGNLIQDGMSELSDELSYLGHSFVSSIATDDIESLLTEQLAKTSEATNQLQANLSQDIKMAIKEEWDQVDNVDIEASLTKANQILSDIKTKVGIFESERVALFRPFTVLTQLIEELLKHKGILVKNVFTFGDVSSAIEAGHLSAGEKQMFSFLCYNAFSKGAMIFIDEPEISLHVDWQRILFPKLMEQGGSNQFIITTHSPFIYSKYSDKEHRLDVDRGSTEESEEDE